MTQKTQQRALNASQFFPFAWNENHCGRICIIQYAALMIIVKTTAKTPEPASALGPIHFSKEERSPVSR
jgi:hypothetical protein